MGGRGSGRPGVRIAVEDTLRIDLAVPAIRSVLSSNGRERGSWTWSQDGEPRASVGYKFDGAVDDKRLTLNYSANGQPVCQTISLVRSRPRFGGWRWWFLCPLLQDRGERSPVRAIFLPPGQRYFGSRLAYGLNYRSQRESHSLSKLLARFAREYA
jgi:hypothetical protein